MKINNTGDIEATNSIEEVALYAKYCKDNKKPIDESTMAVIIAAHLEMLKRIGIKNCRVEFNSSSYDITLVDNKGNRVELFEQPEIIDYIHGSYTMLGNILKSPTAKSMNLNNTNVNKI